MIVLPHDPMRGFSKEEEEGCVVNLCATSRKECWDVMSIDEKHPVLRFGTFPLSIGLEGILFTDKANELERIGFRVGYAWVCARRRITFKEFREHTNEFTHWLGQLVRPYDMLIALTVANNARANHFIQWLGFVPVGNISRRGTMFTEYHLLPCPDTLISSSVSKPARTRSRVPLVSSIGP